MVPLETAGWLWSPSLEDSAAAAFTSRLAAGATLRLLAFRCASANGMTQTATSRSTHNTLRIKCALIVSLVCFFIYSFPLLNVPCFEFLVNPKSCSS